MRSDVIKRVGFRSSILALILSLSSCGYSSNPLAEAAMIPASAAFIVGGLGMVGASQAMRIFETEDRVRESKPKKDGPFTDHWPNGKKEAVGSYKGKQLDGLYTTYYESGKKKSEVIYRSGKRNGPHTSWHENGQKSLEAVFKEGKPEGATKSYHKNGRLRASFDVMNSGSGTRSSFPRLFIRHLESGSPNGTNTAWYDNGQKQHVSTYKNGKLISSKVWNEKGKLTESLRRAPQ
ncbi:MAG: toxin-antitoxin system YwqK family antitoxin [Akkermansiaceae bacterium]|nr:toxin-antitoxin system YwqK family antitoxin [Akkermansiaceae bacterium]